MMGFPERAAVDMFLPVSEAVAEGNGICRKNVNYRVIPNFVADDMTTRQYPHYPELEQLPDEPFVLFVGDLNSTKGADLAVEAYAGLPDAPPLVLIGREFPETPKNLPHNVHVLKSWPHDAVMQAFQRSLFTLAPSRWPEPFGIVVIEALISGRPVIASASGGLPEIIVDQECGFLVPPGDVEALRSKIRLLLDNPYRREQMGKAAAQRAACFYTSTVVPQIEQVYSQLLSQ
jgi:glycosyltransferase involved in cell wall biosynthesis